MVYADAFSLLFDWYMNKQFKAEFLPIHAYTRLRSIFFYSRLAGLSDEEIVANIEAWFSEAKIRTFLEDQSQVSKYVEINEFSAEYAKSIKKIMTAAVENPHELIGAIIA